VCLILSAFLPPAEVRAVFHGRDLLGDEHLSGTFLSLVGLSSNGSKPFECVGTSSETRAAVELTVSMLMKHPSMNENRDDLGGARSSEEQEWKSRKESMIPAGLREVCECLDLSMMSLPEFAGLPPEEEFAAVLEKHVHSATP
jgi:hypothetical protein